MKKILIVLLFLNSFVSFSQVNNAREILQEADRITNNINTLSYWIDHRFKFLTEEDTIDTRAICYLRSAPEDSLKVYHNLFKPARLFHQVYDGNNFLNIKYKDSTYTMINTELYGYGFILGNMNKQLIRYNLFEDSFYSSILRDTLLENTLLEDSVFDNTAVYAITFNYKDAGQIKDRRVTHFIRKKDYFPIGMTRTVNFQNMIEYQSYALSNISVNAELNDKLFDLDYHVPDESKIEYYEPAKKVLPLAEGSTAPAISAETILGKEFNLIDHRGKIIILDFWYRSCHPCIKALPHLQRISTDTDPEEVMVIGVNPFDKKDEIAKFLDERNIDYTNIYNCKTVASDYHVMGYPTLYVINPEGKIHSSHKGWTETLYDDIMEEVNSIR